jgi:hypothetical protein
MLWRKEVDSPCLLYVADTIVVDPDAACLVALTSTPQALDKQRLPLQRPCLPCAIRRAIS